MGEQPEAPTLEQVYEQLARLGLLWLRLLVSRQEIDPDATAVTITARLPDGGSREVAKVTLADAFKRFEDAGIDVTNELQGLI